MLTMRTCAFRRTWWTSCGNATSISLPCAAFHRHLSRVSRTSSVESCWPRHRFSRRQSRPSLPRWTVRAPMHTILRYPSGSRFAAVLFLFDSLMKLRSSGCSCLSITYNGILTWNVHLAMTITESGTISLLHCDNLTLSLGTLNVF